MSAEAERIAGALASAADMSGTLRFFGDWFGRPHDNVHRMTAVEADDDAITLRFDEDETLLIEMPRGLQVEPKARERGDRPRMQIQSASRVRWEWFSYGRPRTPPNRYFIEYVRRSEVAVDRRTNWQQGSPTIDAAAPAVELF